MLEYITHGCNVEIQFVDTTDEVERDPSDVQTFGLF